MVCRVDMHVHAKYSDRPSEWILRRIGAPECHTEPKTVYEIAKRRGMRFVTLTDHNCIRGALEIAHLPDVFVGNEITTYFPEDGCKIHILVWGISEAQFEEIQRVRENLFELRDYLWDQKIVHSCAHPLYSINDRLTVEHFEKLILLFNVFETVNGGRNQRTSALVMAVLPFLCRNSQLGAHLPRPVEFTGEPVSPVGIWRRDNAVDNDVVFDSLIEHFQTGRMKSWSYFFNDLAFIANRL